MEGFEDNDKMATDESIEFKREDHRQIVTDTSGESTANSKRKGDLELGNLISPVAEKVVEVVNFVIPKIQRVPWHHFFILSFFSAIP
jgi:quercetin dioxygenase-like cupin family protein